MCGITYHEPLPEEALRLSIEENTAKLVYLHLTRKGHAYVWGWTGTGKSIVARRLADILEGDYLNCELLSLSEWIARYAEIESQILSSDKPVLVLDGFIPRGAGREFNALLSRLTERGVSLFVFSQEPPFEDNPSVYRQQEFDRDVFNTIVEFRFGTRESRSPVAFHQVK
ncbi:ATPase (plasmid) [Erwinia billingiae]|uniref:ATPase n=1 Tax=Erwinia billingiae TaxID=182337 RepID=UPI001243CC23|nr:ATPase [Erwinia billingiae]QEW34533.1 ATPase [Erwinia billingiae]